MDASTYEAKCWGCSATGTTTLSSPGKDIALPACEYHAARDGDFLRERGWTLTPVAVTTA